MGLRAEEGKMITGRQAKSARKLLGWSLARLASKVAVSDETIRKLESGGHRPPGDIIVSIRHALEAAGIEFMNEGEPGLKVKAAGATIPAAD
jgi:transcriptional regulator with XRE-family HTH domain